MKVYNAREMILTAQTKEDAELLGRLNEVFQKRQALTWMQRPITATLMVSTRTGVTLTIKDESWTTTDAEMLPFDDPDKLFDAIRAWINAPDRTQEVGALFGIQKRYVPKGWKLGPDGRLVDARETGQQ